MRRPSFLELLFIGTGVAILVGVVFLLWFIALVGRIMLASVGIA